jgi:hypothetical protein
MGGELEIAARFRLYRYVGLIPLSTEMALKKGFLMPLRRIFRLNYVGLIPLLARIR